MKRIGVRLTLGYVSILLILGCIIIFSIYRVNYQRTLNEKMRNHPFAVTRAIMNINMKLTDLHQGIHYLIRADDRIVIDESIAKITEADYEICSNFSLLSERFLGDKKLLSDAINAYQIYKHTNNEIIRLKKAGDKIDEDILISTEQQTDDIKQSMKKMSDFALYKYEYYLNELSHVRNNTINYLYLLFIIAIIVCSILSYIITRSIVVPVSSLITASQEISKGNLDCLVAINSYDELGQLENIFDKMVKNLKGLHDELKLHSEIIKNMSEGIALIRVADGIIVYSNPKFDKMFGYDTKELYGKHVSILNAPTDTSPEEVSEKIISSLHSKGMWEGEVYNIKKDGTLFWCNASVAEFDHQEYGHVWVSIHTDISKRKETERLFYYYMDNIDAYVYIKDTDSNYIFINKKTEELFNITREDLKIRKYTDYDFFDKEMAKQLIANDLHIMKLGKNMDIDEVGTVEGYQNTILQSGYRYYLALKFPYYNETGNVIGVCGFSYDITERKNLETALRKQEETIRNMLNILPVGIWIQDKEGKITQANPIAQEIWSGVKYVGVEQFGEYNAWRTTDGKKIEAEEWTGARAILKGETTINEELEIECFDGTHKIILCSSIPLRDVNNEIYGVVSCNQDITDLKNTEKKLRIERDKLTTILDIMNAGIYIVNKNYNVEYVNPLLTREIGENDNKLCFNYMYGKTEPCPWCKLKEVISGETVHWYWHYDKLNKTYQRYDAPIKSEDGSISKIAIFHDITELLNLQKTLKRELDFQTAFAKISEALLDSKLNRYDISKIVYEEALGLTNSSHGYVSIIEESSGDNVAVNLTDMMDKSCAVAKAEQTVRFPRGPHGYNALWGHSLNTGEAFYTNTPSKHPAFMKCTPTGHASIARFLSVPALIGNKVTGQIALANPVNDYTDSDLEIVKRLASIYAIALERKRMEEEIIELNIGLAQKISAEIKMRMHNEQLLIQQTKMATMGEMLNSIAHQWRQPLNAINIVVYDIKDAQDYGELTSEYLNNSAKTIVEQTDFMSKTIDDFRNFMRPSKEKAMFELKSVITQLISMFSPFFIKNSISINLISADEEFNVYGYANEFKHVVLNLTNNSRDAILLRREKGIKDIKDRVDISICRDNGKTIVSISDTGAGIPEDIIDKVFDSHFTTKSADKGTGIGLYMSKTIIESNMGWKLTVRNIDGGAEFRIEI
ncbi:MAG: PAS domain S-box protein [Nitrospirae bacterium]|nr:PAS domain S-box protein [Nitrospirota bacterium]